MRRIVSRRMPDGIVRLVQPFHISMEGLEKEVLCRDDEDYDAFVKIICVSAERKNVIVIIYAVVSNHCHVAILAADQTASDRFGDEVKRIYSMWFNKKYGKKGTLKKVDVKAIPLDSDWYVRNALAYIPRNALDNGCNIADYPWSGYRAMFTNNYREEPGARQVSSLTKEERRRIMHTGDPLNGVPWQIDGKNRLVPRSICDFSYLEQAFENDPAFFLKTIGGQNAAEMRQKLVDAPRKKLTDNEFLMIVEETSHRWFSLSVRQLSRDRKIRLIVYLNRTNKTTVSQLARTFQLERKDISRMIDSQTKKTVK